VTELPLDALETLKSIVGPSGVHDDGTLLEAACKDYFGRHTGTAGAIVFPDTLQAVVECIAACDAHGLDITPQGGKTGLVCGSIPSATGTGIILNLSRLNVIREIDPVNRSVVVDAGVTVAQLHDALQPHELIFPISIGSDGECQIGGVVSTNAGGHSVFRYGMTRHQVLGIEAVLPNATVISNLRALRKDNVGYDLSQLLCGAEGTLGIITGVALKVLPKPIQTSAAFLSLTSIDAVIQLYSKVSTTLSDFLTAFEILPDNGVQLIKRHVPDGVAPAVKQASWYILLEVNSASAAIDLGDILNAELASHFENGLILDAVVSQSESQRKQIWKCREALVFAQGRHGPVLSHDVSVRIPCIPALIDRGRAAILDIIQDVEIICFGHVGDGNLHFNVAHNGPYPAFSRDWQHRIERALYSVVQDLGGSISAEHGIGEKRRHVMSYSRSDCDIDAMRMIKHALDPNGHMNRGKIFGSRT